MMRMELSRMDLVAPYLENSVRIHAVRMIDGRKRLIITDHIERLFRVGPTTDHIVNMALVHRHNGFSGMESAHMSVGRLVDILHAASISPPFWLLQDAVEVNVVEDLLVNEAVIQEFFGLEPQIDLTRSLFGLRRV